MANMLNRVKKGLNSNNRARITGANNVLNTVKTVVQRGELKPIQGIPQKTLSGRPGATPLPVLTKPSTPIIVNSQPINAKTAILAKAAAFTTRKTVIAASNNMKPRIQLGNVGPTQLDMYTNPRPVPGVPGAARGWLKAIKGTGFWGLSYRDYVSAKPTERNILINKKQLEDIEELGKTRAMNRAEMRPAEKSAIVIDGGQILTTVIEQRNGDTSIVPTPGTHTPESNPSDKINGTLFVLAAVFVAYLALR